MSEAQQVTSEMRVKAVYPDAYIEYVSRNWRHYVYAGTYILGKGVGVLEAWNNACTHPTVVAFEAQHRTPEGDTQAMMPFPRPSECDWTEDSPHENGNYQCQCVTCKQSFIGHKRRVQCKLCTSKPVAPDSGKGFAEWWKSYSRPIDEKPNGESYARAAWNAALESAPKGGRLAHATAEEIGTIAQVQAKEPFAVECVLFAFVNLRNAPKESPDGTR